MPQTPPNATILLWLFKIFRGRNPEPPHMNVAPSALVGRVQQKPHYYCHPSFYTNCLLTHHFNPATPLQSSRLLQNTQTTQPVYSISMMTSEHGYIFRDTGPFWGESPVDSHHNAPVTQKFDFQCTIEQTIEQTVELTVIWGTMTLMWCHCND